MERNDSADTDSLEHNLILNNPKSQNWKRLARMPSEINLNPSFPEINLTNFMLDKRKASEDPKEEQTLKQPKFVEDRGEPSLTSRKGKHYELDSSDSLILTAEAASQPRRSQ